MIPKKQSILLDCKQNYATKQINLNTENPGASKQSNLTDNEADAFVCLLFDLRWLTTVFKRLKSARYDFLPVVNIARADKIARATLKQHKQVSALKSR